MKEKIFKIKRKVEGDAFGCKISYVSAHGFSYSFKINGALMEHIFCWYMVSNYKYEGKYLGRKNDLTNLAPEKAYAESPEITERLISYYERCCACTQGCLGKTAYEFNGKNLRPATET